MKEDLTALLVIVPLLLAGLAVGLTGLLVLAVIEWRKNR